MQTRFWRERPRFAVLGTPIDAVQIADVVAQMERWIQARARSHFIAVTGMHGVMEARRDPGFARVLCAADLVVPDGMSVVWVGRRRGYPLWRRVYGPELMETFFRETGGRYRHFLYGATQPVLDRLAGTLARRLGANVVGVFAPPFRPLTPDEDAAVVGLINRLAPDVVWVGLSTPKQERWMYEHAARLNVPVMVGVGAAFDILSGAKAQAPPWMRERGLEWLFRLMVEPRRLWRRSLVYGPWFVYLVAREEWRLRAQDAGAK